MSNLDFRSHKSWTERIHDNLVERILTGIGGDIDTILDITSCPPDAILNILPDATIPQANVTMAVAPRGTGAFQTSEMPGGGDCRGVNAVDMQMLRDLSTQVASGDASVIGGGANNTTSTDITTISGGADNTVTALGGTIGGGADNVIDGFIGTIGGGNGNEIDVASVGSSIIGGAGNMISGASLAVLCGGAGNTVSGAGGTICGGSGNTVLDSGGFIGGGGSNVVSAGSTNCVVGGGSGNVVGGSAGFIGGGAGNTVSGTTVGVVCGGRDNSNSGVESFIGGGGDNEIIGGQHNVLVGGFDNDLTSSFSFLGGGAGNTITGGINVLVGGSDNTVSSASNGTVGGGVTNVVSGDFGCIPGGRFNTVSGINSFCCGLLANDATNDGCFVFGGSGGATATAANQATFGVTGGFRVLAGGAPGALITLDGPVTMPGKLTVGGVIDPTGMVLTEQAAVPQAPIAGEGTIWVRNDAPNNLIFTDDVGTDWQLNHPNSYATYKQNPALLPSGEYTNTALGNSIGIAGAPLLASGTPYFFDEAGVQGNIFVLQNTNDTANFALVNAGAGGNDNVVRVTRAGTYHVEASLSYWNVGLTAGFGDFSNVSLFLTDSAGTEHTTVGRGTTSTGSDLEVGYVSVSGNVVLTALGTVAPRFIYSDGAGGSVPANFDFQAMAYSLNIRQVA